MKDRIAKLLNEIDPTHDIHLIRKSRVNNDYWLYRNGDDLSILVREHLLSYSDEDLKQNLKVLLGYKLGIPSQNNHAEDLPHIKIKLYSLIVFSFILTILVTCASASEMTKNKIIQSFKLNRCYVDNNTTYCVPFDATEAVKAQQRISLSKQQRCALKAVDLGETGFSSDNINCS